MRAGRILAVAVVAAVGVGPVVLPAAADRADAATTAPTLVVAPRGGGVVRDGSALDVDVVVTNPTGSALPAGRLTTSMTASPIASTDELFVTPSQLQGFLLTRSTARTPAIAAGASAQVRVRIAVQDLEETLKSGDGARLLDVQLQAGRTRVIGQSAVTRMGDDSRRIGLGTVVPITIPAGITGIADVQQQADLTASDGAWTRALAAAEAMPGATIALDPAVVASIRLAGDAAPASATSFLDDLRGFDGQEVELAYADGDLALQRAAGLRAPVGPLSFAGATAATSSAPNASATPAATPAPTATPGTTDLTDWDWSSTRIAWPVPGTTTTADLAAIGTGRTVLLASSDLQDGAARVAAGPLATVSGQRVLVADATVGSLLAAAAADDAAGRSAAASLTAVLATDAVTGAASAVLAVAGRGVDADGLSRTLRLLAAQSWIRGDDLGTLSAQDDPTAVQLKSGTAVSTSRATTARSLATAEAAVSRVAAAAADPDALTGPYQLSLLGALSAAWARDQTGWSTVAAEARSAFEAMPQQIAIANSGPLTPVGTDGQLPVRVQNRLSQPVQVVVTATVNNNRLRFTGSGTRVTVPANATGTAKLPFQSISNGTSVVTLSLATPQGVGFGTAQEQPVTVRAGFDTVVAVILLVALGLLLALGIYRNVTRRRRPRTAR